MCNLLLDCKKIKRKHSTENLYNDDSKDMQGICSTCTHQGLLILLSPTGTILFQLLFKKKKKYQRQGVWLSFLILWSKLIAGLLMLIELWYWDEEIWCKFSVWNIKIVVFFPFREFVATQQLQYFVCGIKCQKKCSRA